MLPAIKAIPGAISIQAFAPCPGTSQYRDSVLMPSYRHTVGYRYLPGIGAVSELAGRTARAGCDLIPVAIKHRCIRDVWMQGLCPLQCGVCTATATNRVNHDEIGYRVLVADPVHGSLCHKV